MSILQILFLFVVGLCVGSFLNVLIYRLPHNFSPLKGRSFCPKCKHKLAWQDNIPLLSFVLLRGRCRHCLSQISWQYPIVELITGIFFVLIYRWVISWCSHSMNCYVAILAYFCIVSSLITVFFTDLKYQIIPDVVILSAIILTLLYTLFVIRLSASEGSFLPFTYLLSALAAGGFFLSLVILTKGKGMGMGDVKLSVLIGLILGFPKVIIALYLAFLTGAAVGVILILARKKRFGDHIPFGPFLVAGTLIGMFWGEKIIELWLRII